MKNFEEASNRTKRRKTEELRKEKNISELLYAAQMNLRRSCNNNDAAKIVKDIADNPTQAKCYVSALNTKSTARLPADKALSVIVEAKLSRHQYNTIRASMKETNCDLYPNYETVRPNFIY